MSRVVVGVTGGIAAYKACILVRLLRKSGIDVHVISTAAALTMVGRTTWEALSGNPVYTETTDDAANVTHVRLGHEADLIIVAPATANTLAKLRAGLADNLLTSTILAVRCPVMLAPAMHTEMWLNPATQENAAVLADRGFQIIEPASGRLTGADAGIGRLPEPEELCEAVLCELGGDTSLAGKRIAISAGGTHESIDPVRFIGNNSSGRFGVALAREAHRRGGEVTIVAANVDSNVLKDARGVSVQPVVSARDLHDGMRQAAERADIVIMAAAVADFRPEHESSSKQKKDGTATRSLDLVENPDILFDLAHHRSHAGQMVIGFAAETGDGQSSVLEYGRAKAARKGADLMVVNEVGTARGFGNVDTAITIIDAGGTVHGSGQGSKADMASLVFDTIQQLQENM
ncbi:bifunctional phosphopantothenoylcysteine decarboxylase/phosphopantothenate--cysteine ligase CoaBC [Ancrocorticia sp.]|uniref:bifunctional phosphopantothenoylcysteine decarboxylase/phosphopantothenate--cysteine ligase CoaBC n=1 Tax=Ancrocorticia sp. TaxID=2593684 RepID=UPI003F93787B